MITERRYPDDDIHAGMSKSEAEERNRAESYLRREVRYPDGTVETGQEAERRIAALGLRPAWTARTEELFTKGRKAAKAGTGEPVTMNDARLAALLEFPPGCDGAPEVGDEAADAEFARRIKGALHGLRYLPNRAAIDRDLEWIAANYVVDAPDVSKAPSRLALVWSLECRRDPAIRKQFWQHYQSKCMSPGEPLRKRAKDRKVFEEDAEDDEACSEAELRAEQSRILFGEGS